MIRVCCGIAIVTWGLTLGSVGAAEPPKLVVVVIADQMRPVLMRANKHRLMPDGGLRRFLDNGISYRNAAVDHGLTLTAPGHATISTGAMPRDHGIVANEWFDRALQGFTESVTDPDSPVLGDDGDWTVSPKKIKTRTFSDQLNLDSRGRSKVVAIGGKDRGAVFMAGYSGKAYFYSSNNGGIVTSRFYEETLPDWVKAFNKNHNADSFPEQWQLSRAESEYLLEDDQPHERPPGFGVGRVFPHDLGDHGEDYYYRIVKRTPYVDAMALRFAALAMDKHDLGTDRHTDILSLSLNATDYIGHDFGPNSRETEDNLFRLDKALGEFMDAVEKRVPAKDVLYVLTADHGVDASPEYRQAQGIRGYRLDVPWLTAELNRHIGAELKTDQIVVSAAFHSGVFFSQYARDNYPLEKLQSLAIEWLKQQPAVEESVPIPGGSFSNETVDELMQRAIYAPRMGDVLILVKPDTFFGWPSNAATHGSPYLHDRHIPLIFLTHKRQGRDVYTPATQRSIVPTLSALLNVSKPAQALATPLAAVLEDYRD